MTIPDLLRTIIDRINGLKTLLNKSHGDIEVGEINFCDFNGLFLSMTREEVMSLTEMPTPPSYNNLTFQHWSKTLEEIQDGRCHTVAAFYYTSDDCNYFVIDVTQDGESVKFTTQIVCTLLWGDGTESTSNPGYATTHTYEKKGKYTIVQKPLNGNVLTSPGYYGYDEVQAGRLVEMYYNKHLTIIETMRHCKKLTKLCIPDGNITQSFDNDGVWQFTNCNKLKSLILPSGVTGNLAFRYSGTNLPKVECLVADGINGLWEPMSMVNLKCFSLKNVKKIGTSTNQLYLNLKRIVFDSLVTVTASVFTNGGLYTQGSYNNYLSLVDLPESCTSIANQSFTMLYGGNVYIRSLTPPTLAGTSVFRRGGTITIHIRKDATYTDAAGTTYTGIEAYAHATNWVTLYASSNYTFIDDL